MKAKNLAIEFNTMKKERKADIEELIKELPFNLSLRYENGNSCSEEDINSTIIGSTIEFFANESGLCLAPLYAGISLSVSFYDNYKGSWKHHWSDKTRTEFTNSETKIGYVEIIYEKIKEVQTK